MFTTKVVHGTFSSTCAPRCSNAAAIWQAAAHAAASRRHVKWQCMACTITHLATQGHRFLHLLPFHACQCCPEGAAMSSGSSDLRGHVRCRGFEVEAMVRGLLAILFRKHHHALCQKCQGESG